MQYNSATAAALVLDEADIEKVSQVAFYVPVVTALSCYDWWFLICIQGILCSSITGILNTFQEQGWERFVIKGWFSIIRTAAFIMVWCVW